MARPPADTGTDTTAAERAWSKGNQVEPAAAALSLRRCVAATARPIGDGFVYTPYG